MVDSDPVADRAEKVRAYEEVLQSRTFARSEQLVQFLRYICELEVAGRGSEITEYSIATHALNRPAEYAPGEDSSVRSRAHTLRRKLNEYYETEAPHSEMRVELPKGTYRPQFVRWHEPVSTKPEPQPTTTRPVLWPRLNLPWAIVASSIILALTALIVTRERSLPIDSVVREA